MLSTIFSEFIDRETLIKAKMEELSIEIEARRRLQLLQQEMSKEDKIKAKIAELKAKKEEDEILRIAKTRIIREELPSPYEPGISKQEKDLRRTYKMNKEIQEEKYQANWSCPDDDKVYHWTFQGKKYFRNYYNEIYYDNCDMSNTVGAWVGVYIPSQNRIDTTVPEPEYDD